MLLLLLTRVQPSSFWECRKLFGLSTNILNHAISETGIKIRGENYLKLHKVGGEVLFDWDLFDSMFKNTFFSD